MGAIERSLLLGSDLLEENVALARRRAGSRPPVRARVRWERRDVVAEGRRAATGASCSAATSRSTSRGERRDRLHRALASALAPDGVLLLGRSERLTAPESSACARWHPRVRRLP
jgi:chemotaxis protein methyltransferase CheR